MFKESMAIVALAHCIGVWIPKINMGVEPSMHMSAWYFIPSWPMISRSYVHLSEILDPMKVDLRSSMNVSLTFSLFR